MGHKIKHLFFFVLLVSVEAFIPSSHGKNNFLRVIRVVNCHDRYLIKRDVAPDIVSSLIVATIDSDIASIPTNEFAPIFAGGIAVMFGGLFSALAVGFIIDKRDLYANIVADSYAQGADDAEFWKGLSEEEKKKTEELLQRLRESKEGAQNKKVQSIVPIVPPTTTNAAPNGATIAPVNSNVVEEKREIGMFSDYGED